MSRFEFSSFSEDELCNESLTYSPEAEWGVWCDNDQQAISLTTCQQRVRCGERKPCTTPPPDSKCVFKWASATTATANNSTMLNCSSMSRSCSGDLYIDGGDITGLGLHHHGLQQHVQPQQCFVV